MNCLDRETATAYLSGDLDPVASHGCACHVSVCSDCAGLIEETSELIDMVRRDLRLLDVPSIAPGLPSLDLAEMKRRIPGPMASKFPTNRGRSLWRRSALVAATLAVVALGLLLHAEREKVTARELLRRADQAVVNASTVPGRIVHRTWKEEIRNGLGPLPDGNYWCESWKDNVRNLSAFRKYSSGNELVDGQWHFEDRSDQVFNRYGWEYPVVTVGPLERQILEEIELLPLGDREAVRAFYKRLARPITETSAELVARTERDLTTGSYGQLLFGRNLDARIQHILLPSGAAAYRVSFSEPGPSPDSRIGRWDVDRLILDKSFVTIETRSKGHRTDGGIFESNMLFQDEQVFLPGEVDPTVFSPGPFPQDTEYRYTTAKKRVEFLLHLAMAQQSKEERK